MRALGIDYGDARIGFALSDISLTLASPFKMYKSISMRKDIDFVANLALQNDVAIIVLGLPLNMDGSVGFRATKTQAFGRVINKVTGLEVIYQDERLTTIEAEQYLIENNMRRDKRKEVIDMVSAQIILQNYLDLRKKENING